ncbi:hypothetical protein [Streptomyces sp. A5-4]|uniref:hypothetical protein n=1 Tax=Streptomyces sp. A5-4 TaxID=3384771 RepID=UPI003DA9D8BE
MTNESKRYTRKEVDRLAALSRAYQEARADITAAIVQETMAVLDPEHRADVGARFGLSPEELSRYRPEEVLRLRNGHIHRASLRSADDVLADVMLHIELGRLNPGDQLPPRTAFTATYRCDKRTHKQVVDHLIRDGVIHRPGGQGGPLYVAPLDAETGRNH